LGPFVGVKPGLLGVLAGSVFARIARVIEAQVDDDGDLVAEFLARVVGTYAKSGLPTDELGAAMLVAAINLIIADIGAADTARLLAGLSSQLFPHGEAGHA
jgi:hypothetical protein